MLTKTYNLVFHWLFNLFNILLFIWSWPWADGSRCSPFSQSLLTGHLLVGLGSSPDWVLFCLDPKRPHQTQFGIIKGVLLSLPLIIPPLVRTQTAHPLPPRGTHKFHTCLPPDTKETPKWAWRISLRSQLSSIPRLPPLPSLPASHTPPSLYVHASVQSCTAHCGTAAMRHPMSLRPQSHLWSLFLSLLQASLVLSLIWATPRLSCYVPPFACRQQHNKQFILPLPHLALDHQIKSQFIVQWVWPAVK